ncbi:FlgD immunoglobulin-like domain containing protein [Spirochaeta dissipatitropha]
MLRKLSFSGVFLAICLILPAAVWADYNPPAGTNDLDRLLSPRALSVGDFGLIDEYPAASSSNPAAASHVQRSQLDLSYLAAIQLGGSGWAGHVINLGAMYPSPAGVFGANLQMVFSGLEESLNTGALFRLQSSFAKPLYDTIDFGLGFDLLTGFGDQFDIGASASIGYIHHVSHLTGLENARYGIAMSGIGKWYRGFENQFPYPSPFTPSFEFAYSPVVTENLKWDLYSRLSFPAFQNVRFGIGTELGIGNRLDFSGGMQLDLRSILENPSDPGLYIPSVGFQLRFPVSLSGENGLIAERGWQQNEIRLRSGVTSFPGNSLIAGIGINAALGSIDINPPEISLSVDDRTYISPNNDGVQDYLQFPLEITDERYVMRYRFVVENEDGDIIRSIDNVDQRPESEGVRNFIDRFLSVTTGLEIPESIRWNGRLDDGSVALDGEYRFYVEAWDDNDNRGTSTKYTVIVDNTAPVVELQVPVGDELIFSPSEDSFQNFVRVGQSGSIEDLWKGTVYNASGEAVRDFSWRNSEPGDMIWDGMNSDGEVVRDGVYSYSISATDRAGNSVSASVSNIIINTEPTPVSLNISRSIFSPNNNGVNDTIRILPEIGNTRGIRDWSVQIKNARGSVVRTFGDVGVPRDSGLLFDGRGDNGQRLPEGAYHAELVVVYRNGNRPEARSPNFTIDVTPPSARVQAEYPVFSPNNSGIRDTQIFTQDSSVEEVWTGVIRNQQGEVIRQFNWDQRAASEFHWDGRTSTGALAADGIYAYYLESTDRAGNTGRSNRVDFELNTEETPVLITSNHDAFSPSSYKDTISIIPNLRKNDDIEYFVFEILDSEDNIVRTSRGSDVLTSPFVWDGRSSDGFVLPDGRYRSRLEILYLNGNLEEAYTDYFVLDTVAPAAEIAAEYLLFSPDGDGRRDVVPFTQSNLTDDYWIGSIRTMAGEVIREYRWGSNLRDFTWDGTDSEGNLLPDGSYYYELRSEDAAGNRTQYRIDSIVIDTRPTSLFATVDLPAIAPGQGSEREEQRINLFVNLTDGADKWTLDILDSSQRIVRTFQGKDVQSSFQIVWDGKNEAGRIIEGEFRARFSVDYEKGNAPVAVTRSFLVDVSPPEATVRLHPLPFSPDNDGVDDILNINLQVEDASAIGEWRFEIRDRNQRVFHVIEGRGQPGRTLTWDGRSSVTGNLVISAEDYPYTFTVSDALGNTTQLSGVIPVDILVIRDGDRLKVQIPSITFSPNSPELIIDPETEIGQKNLAIIERLTEIFTRYNTYSIQVEGHAVNLSGTAREEREELQPLSFQRAESVKAALVRSGLSAGRITAVGRGGMEPIVPHTDADERWQNRRVEFILIR